MEISVEDNIIIVKIPYSEEAAKTGELTSTGNSRMIDTTKGFVPVLNGLPSNIKVSVNLIAVLPKEERPKK